MNKTSNPLTQKMTNYRWTICIMMFLALTINYLDRQVLSLTWDEFIKPEFHWNEIHYGYVTATFSIVYAIGMLFAGRAVDWLGTKAGFLWSIGIWSAGACLHALCGIATEFCTGLEDKTQLIAATGDMAVMIATASMYFFLAARCVLAIGEAGYFPAAVKGRPSISRSATAPSPHPYSTPEHPSAHSWHRSPYRCWQSTGAGRWRLSSSV